MTSFEKKDGGCFLVLVSTVIGIPLAMILYSWAAMLNWNWFATTIGMPRIGFWQAFGLTLVISSMRPWSQEKKREDKSVKDLVVEMFILMISRFVMSVGLGYAVHALMEKARGRMDGLVGEARGA
jgi:hypothetical protein